MSKQTEPKRKVGKSLEADIEMIESCLVHNDEEMKSEDEEEDQSIPNTDKEEGNTANVKSSSATKSGFAKSVSWSESEENTPRYSTSSTAKAQPNLGARPKTGKHLNPLIRQKQSLEDGKDIIDEIRESGEESSIIRQETSSSATVTKTTSVVKKSSTLMEKIRQRSSLSRSRSEISEEEDTTESDDEDQDPNDVDSSIEGDNNNGDRLNNEEEKEREIEEEEDKETVGPLKKLSSSKKKSSASSAGSGRKGPTRQALQKQGSRYDIRLREEDQSAQIAYEKRQESRKEKTRKHWSDLRDSVHSGSFHSAGMPTKEESYDFFTKVWENTPSNVLSTSQQKRTVREDNKKKKKQRRGDSRDEPSGGSDEDLGGDESDNEDR